MPSTVSSALAKNKLLTGSKAKQPSKSIVQHIYYRKNDKRAATAPNWPKKNKLNKMQMQSRIRHKLPRKVTQLGWQLRASNISRLVPTT